MKYGKAFFRSLALAVASALALTISCESMFVFPFAGFVLGSAQWLALRRSLEHPGLWIWANGFGWVLAHAVVAVLDIWLKPGAPAGWFVFAVVFGAVQGGLHGWAIRKQDRPLPRVLTLIAGASLFFAGFCLLAELLLPRLRLGFFLPDRLDVESGYLVLYYPVIGIPAMIWGCLTGLALQPAGSAPVRSTQSPTVVKGLKVALRTAPFAIALVAWLWKLPVMFASPHPPEPESLRLKGTKPPEVVHRRDDESWSSIAREFRTPAGRRFLAYEFFRTGPDQPVHDLLLFVQGSGWRSVRGFCERKLARFVQPDRRLVCVERLGVAPDTRSMPPGFFRTDTKQERIRNVNQAIDFYSGGRTVRRVWLAGHSEGSDVAAGVAASRDDVNELSAL